MATVAKRLAGFAKDLKQVPKLSPAERLALLDECENQWHWSADVQRKRVVKRLVNMGLMRFAKHPSGDNVTGWEVTGLGRAVAAGLRPKRPEATIGTHSPSRSRTGVGKKRTTSKKKPKTPREQFAARLRDLVGDRPASDFADAWDSTPDGVLKYLRGDRTPKLDQWPKIAASLGLKNWQDLLPPTE